MGTNTANKIIEYIKNKKQAGANELAEYLSISRQALYKQLAKLLRDGKVYKIGRPPKVFYLIKEYAEQPRDIEIDKDLKKIVNKNFLIITPSGKRKEGMDGFIYWCEKYNQPIAKTAVEYKRTLRKYEKFKKNGLVDGMHKMKNTFSKVNLDNLFYLDFYSIERFGKTKLGQFLLYAKQSQDKKIMAELVAHIRPAVSGLIKKYKIDGVGFVPPTVKREVQFMKELEKKLHLAIKKIFITKIKTEVAVPQKTLSRLEERIENARTTFVVEDSAVYNNILLIDDALGSGATLNEIAAQIKNKGLCRGRIIGLAITGSFKGFDVISEV
jgi:hypoxanthine-guanine phosphoribosyltransferase/biotin operon repressor